MKLYANTTSERASKGQGGNEYLDIELLVGNSKDPAWAGTIRMTEIAPNNFQVFYTAPIAGKGKSQILYTLNLNGTVFQETKGKSNCDCNKNYGTELQGIHNIDCNNKKGKKQKTARCEVCNDVNCKNHDCIPF